MRINNFTLKSTLKAVLGVSCLLLFSAVAGFAQVNLTAGPATAPLPDGSAVPMWGYSCGAVVTGSTATCAPLNPAATAGMWSPVVITVPYVSTGTSLTINLTNNLSFTAGTGTNTVPTSLVIVGQLGGGLGTTGSSCTDANSVNHGVTCTPSPDHTNAQPLTWPIAGDAPGAPPTQVGFAPAQGNRVQSFSTEVAACTPVAPATTCTSTPTALTWTNLRPGTYLIESGTHPSIQGPMGLYGMLVVTSAPATALLPFTAYPGVNYNADERLLFSEIDPVQNNAVQAAVTTSGFSETMVWSGQPSGCGNLASPTYHQCYPPAVNYTPLYYLINGVAFNKTNAAASLFTTSPASIAATPGTKSILVRMVNAGLHMHVPSIVGAQTGTAVAPALPASGFSLIAEDGNPLPGVPRVQSEVFMAAGKTYDVMINVPAAGGSGLPVFDRELSLSGNAISRDAGMLAYIGINGAGVPAAPAFAAAVARADGYPALVAGQPLTVSDVSKGVMANDTNVYGVTLLATPASGTVVLNANGTFTYTPTNTTATTVTPDSFTYCANGTVTGAICSSGVTASVSLAASNIADSGITCTGQTFNASMATYFAIKTPGVLAGCKDGANLKLTVDTATVAATGMTVVADANGGFTATPTGTGAHSFTFQAKNSQSLHSATTTVNVVFPTASNLAVTVLDGVDKTTTISDYRWIIEEDRTFYLNPACMVNPAPAGCSPAGLTGLVPTFGTNFHTSYMPVVATGCTGATSCEGGQTMVDPTTGAHVNAVCDVGNGVCRIDPTGNGFTPTYPSDVHLDPTKRYYLSVLPGDAATPFETGNVSGGHVMGGAEVACIPTLPALVCDAIAGTFPAVTVLVEPNPVKPAKLSVFVFEDDFPLNGEQDAGGGVDILATNEPGLGGFEITLFDDAGGTGDATGQLTHDMFNQPLSNSLAGTPDPANNNQDACPISPGALTAMDSTNGNAPRAASPTGITGRIVTCPTFEADGTTLSPLAGQAVVANMMAGRYGVVATPAADRIGRGEEWLQTNTLDGQKAHDSFLRVGEPAYFQEYGPAGFHVSIGFANPKIINARLNGPDGKSGICGPGGDGYVVGLNCNNSVTGSVVTERMSRTPDERLFGSGSYSSFSFTQCYVSIGDPDGEDFAFTKCDSNGNFNLAGLPDGNWRITIFDQWNDMLVDGLSTPVALGGGNVVNMGQIAINQWQSDIYTSTFFDLNGNGVRDSNDPGLTLVSINNRFRDGSFSNFNSTDLNGNAGFNEVFPLFSWYVVESDTTRYKNTGTHVVYDAGGPADGTPCGTATTPPTAPCGNSGIAANMANTYEAIPLLNNLRVPGAYYCSTADCLDAPVPLAPHTLAASGPGGSTGRVDPPWVLTEGWQGFSGQNNFLEFGKKPYAVGETGGIRGHVIYASTRPFDDPQLLLQTSWEPLVPGVTINLYKEATATDGVTTTLTLIDTTKTSSWDDWAQGFRSDGVPNMNCPGQGAATGTNADLFFYSIYNQPNYLDVYNSQHNGGTLHTLPSNSQYKCYDGMHNWNQLQPAPYDGMYQFPSVTGIDPNSGKPVGTNCTGCVSNPDTTDAFRSGTPMLPAGKYVVEVVVPPGYELVKEEDKNILIGDNYIAPVAQEFGALGSVFIMPDQAAVGSSYNPNNAQNPTQDFGSLHLPRGEGDTGSVESFWPCVGESRIVPDYISLYPGSLEVAPFAGATRNLCDRKEVTLNDQMSALAKFYIFTSTHAAAHFTGVITDDFTSEFDPFSPQFGEKFAPPDLPIAIKDFNGNEVLRIYADHWGAYNGLNYSTWDVNPPNPTGYAPTMMVTCMNDPGAGATPDALFNPQYSNFCYEIPFMPGQTQYMDTPVTPTAAYAGAGYNNPDCAYPNATPAILSVNGDGVGPWISAVGHTITINALGDQMVNNNGYSGPAASTDPFDLKKVLRHYGFGAARGSASLVATNPAGNTVTTALTITGWSDTQITATVPTGVPPCPVQQQSVYRPSGGGASLCGQLVITTANTAGTGLPSNAKQSIDTVTVTIGGKPPIHVAATANVQAAIDSANPGDMLMIDPGVHKEMLIMWKPIRLQGVGAASSIINADPHPAGRLDPWRAQVACLFGLATNGQPFSSSNPAASTCGKTGATAWAGWNSTPFNPQVDRLPLEGIVGWDTSVNGNLAEQLQEPSLMGAYEAGAITVLGKGVNIVGAGSATGDIFGSGAEAGFPAGSTLLAPGDCGTTGRPSTKYPSNFLCNPSSIDGLGLTNSSQGGGGIFVHAWAHELQIANDRVYNNAGTLTGGISLGQGEFPDAYLYPDTSSPSSCMNASFNTRLTFPTNTQLPYCFNTSLNVHNNMIVNNASTGDELFSATPAGAGGVSICTGADFYKFNYNWVCGNLSTGDGGGVAHMGFSYNGDIEHNTFLFNQSTNPTIPTSGGGLLIMGAPPDGSTLVNGVLTECGTVIDTDCVPGLGDGVGPGLTINANLIMGNSAESGTGGGLRFQAVNGADVARFINPGACTTQANCQWYVANVTNNIITNNVAGWDGGGVSLEDSIVVNFTNNTVASNDSTASAGVLFNTLGAPLSSSQVSCNGQGIPGTTCTTAAAPQPAGLVALTHSAQLTSSFTTGTIVCPATHPNCTRVSIPLLSNDIFWQNRSFYIGVGSLGAANLNQQNIVTLFNSFTTTTPATQTATGSCPSGSAYWDIGVRGDTTVAGHESTFRLAPTFSVLTDAGDYPSLNNFGSNPAIASQYCNGSRVPPEFGGTGFQVPPGISDATVPNPLFSLTPAATVDEGNNWVNMSWGPLALTNPVTNATLGNYALLASSPAIDAIPSTVAHPTTDYFGNPRPDPAVPARFDVGAIEFQGTGTGGGGPIATVTGGPLAFGNVVDGTTSAARTLTLSNTGTSSLTGITLAFSSPRYSRPGGAAGGTCTATLAPGTCTINVVFNPTTPGLVNATLTITGSVAVTGSPVALSGTGIAPATVLISPNPLTITLATGVITGTGTVTLTNNSAAGSPSATVSTAVVAGGNGVTFLFNKIAGQDNCTGAVLAPTQSCTVGVRFTNGTAARGTNRAGTITFTDTAAGSPQVGNLIGHANP